MKKSRGQSGFTLVEMVVGITVLSLIMLASVTALRTFGNTQASLGRMTDRVDEVRTVSGFIRDALDSAVVGAGSSSLSMGGGSSSTSYFRGAAGWFEWKAPLLFGEEFGGTFFVRLSREGGQLLLRWQEVEQRRSPLDWAGTRARSLVQDLQEFSVSFRDADAADWTNEWNVETPPAMVRVRMKSGGRYWPDLIMRVQR